MTCENYNPATGSGTVQIDRKPVTVTPQSGQTKAYGEPDAVPVSYTHLDACLAAAKILPTVRGETLALEDFARIAWKVEEIKKK